MATAAANRGKQAEKEIRAILNDMNRLNVGFTFDRVPDAHAAGGRFQPLAGDYQAFVKGSYAVSQGDTGYTLLWAPGGEGAPASRNFLIEVKEVKHDFRLPHKNYSEDKVARVQKRVWAGSEAIVPVLHTTTGEWRLVPFEVFTKRSGGSWDLSAYPPVDIRAALAEFMGVKA